MSRYWNWLILIIIILCAFALRLYRLDFQDIWWDEARNIDVASRNLAVIATAKEMDIHPPLYFYTLHLWMLAAGRSEFAVRFLSVFFSLLTIPLFYRFGVALSQIANRKSQIWDGLLAATIAAFAPFYISEAQETRMYTMAIFLTTASAYCLYRAWREGGRLLWAGYVLTSALSIYTHYSAGFILIAENVFLGLMVLVTAWQREKWLRVLRGWVLSQLGIALLYLPQLRIALRQVVAYKNPTMGVPDLPSFLVQVWQSFSLGPAAELIQAIPFLAGIAFILVLGLVIGLASLKSLIWLCLWLALPLLLYFYILRDRPFFHPRYIMLATPPYYLLLAYALGQIWKRVPAVGRLSVIFLLAAFVPAIRADYFDPAGFSDDTRGLARFIESQAGENDIVLIDVPYPFDYYYRGRAPAHYLFVDIHTVAQRLTELCQGRERVFWIRWHKSDTDPRGSVLFLLDKYGQRLGQADFRGYDVLWYQLPPHGYGRDSVPCRFSLTSEVNSIDVDFADQISLRAYDYGGRGAAATSSEAEVKAKVVPAGKKMWAVLQWQLQQEVDRNYKVALFLKDSRGHLIGQDDRQLINDRHLYTASWWLDEVVTNVYDPLVPNGTPPGQYAIEVAVYDPESLARLDVLDANGAPQGTTVQLGTIEVSRPLSPPPVASLGIQHELTADWGEIRLLGYDLAGETVAPGATLSLNLYWQALADVQRDYFVLIRVSDQAGQVWGQVRERPVASTYPTTLWQEGEILRDRYDLPISVETPAGLYQLTAGLMDADTQSLVGEIALSTLTVEGRSRVFQVPPIQRRLSANLDGQAELLGYDLDRNELQAGENVHLTLYWRALDEMDASYTVFVHLIDKENQIWGQRDSVPGNGILPTTGWVRGEVITDDYEFTVRPEAPPGEYLIEVGMYDAQTSRRLPVLRGPKPEDRILLNEVVVVK